MVERLPDAACGYAHCIDWSDAVVGLMNEGIDERRSILPSCMWFAIICHGPGSHIEQTAVQHRSFTICMNQLVRFSRDI